MFEFFLRLQPSPQDDAGLTDTRQVQHIYFLKTHKTASSTVTNILIRYGDTRNLEFVLPRNILTPFNWPQRFHLDNAYPLHSEPNILCSHGRHSHKALIQIFHKPKSKYITIIRNPVENFKSSFAFFNMTKLLGLEASNHPIEAFMRAPDKFKDRKDNRNIALWYRVRNSMLFDTGLDHRYFHNKTAVKRHIDFINQEFDLIMIADYFDESLILLKRLLRWDFEDILYIKHNVARRRLKEKLTDETKKEILAWNWADSLFFDHFNETLWRKIQEIGPEFFQDLKTFRFINNDYQDLCKSMKTYEKSTQNDKKHQIYKTCVQMKRDNRRFYYEKINQVY